ncbi:MAG: response regulator transcription factor [Sciscionella sp.]
MSRLMVVEDDATIGEVLDSSLRAHGHEVDWLGSGRDAVKLAGERDFDLVLLDLGLPDLDGVEVCRQLRAKQPGCVLVILTARQDEMDVVVGLEAGADDYLTKPVRLTELLARLRAHLRRGVPVAAPEPVLKVGALRVDTAGRRVSLAGHEIALRAKEFDLLARLAAEPGVAVGREVLISEVWDQHWFGSTKTLDVHIAALRQKLGAITVTGDMQPQISTLRGHGYRLEAAAE